MADEPVQDQQEAPSESDAGEQQPKAADVPPEVKAALRKANKEAEALRLKLKEFEDRDKTEAQRLAERAAAAERSAADAQRELARLRVITEVGLPADLHEFVTGADEDELRAKANRLKAQFGAEQRAVDVGLGSRSTPPAGDMNSIIRQQVAARRGQ